MHERRASAAAPVFARGVGKKNLRTQGRFTLLREHRVEGVRSRGGDERAEGSRRGTALVDAEISSAGDVRPDCVENWAPPLIFVETTVQE